MKRAQQGQLQAGDWDSYVLITRGRWKGRLGLYDDDEGPYAIVYLATPFASAPVVVRHSSCRYATANERMAFVAEHESPRAVARAWERHFVGQRGAA